MKSCDRIEKNAHKYYDGALPQREYDQITAHLQSCPRCSAAYAWAKRSRAMLRALPRRTPSANFNIVLHAKMRHAEYERRNIWPLGTPSWVWQAPAYGAAALLLIAAGVFIDRQLEFPASLPVSAQMTAENAAMETLVPSPAVESASSIDLSRDAAGLTANSVPPASRSARHEAPAGGQAVASADPVQLSSSSPAVKRYVMQKIPMQSLLQENRRTVGNRQADLEQLAYDSMQVRAAANRSRTLSGVRAYNASVQF